MLVSLSLASTAIRFFLPSVFWLCVMCVWWSFRYHRLMKQSMNTIWNLEYPNSRRRTWNPADTTIDVQYNYCLLLTSVCMLHCNQSCCKKETRIVIIEETHKKTDNVIIFMALDSITIKKKLCFSLLQQYFLCVCCSFLCICIAIYDCFHWWLMHACLCIVSGFRRALHNFACVFN